MWFSDTYGLLRKNDFSTRFLHRGGPPRGQSCLFTGHRILPFPSMGGRTRPPAARSHMPRRNSSKSDSAESLKVQILAVKLRAEQVKLRMAEWKAPIHVIGSFTPLPDDTLVHLRPPPELNLETSPYDRKKLDYARRIGLAPPAEDEEATETETEITPDPAPVYVPDPPHPDEATDPEYKALMERARKAIADYHGN